MLTEMIVLSPVGLACLGYVPFWIAVVWMGLLYTLPKPVFIAPLEFFTDIVFRGPQSNEQRIALTFDDVPYTDQTQQLLSGLKAQRLKATLFVISGQVKTQAEKELLVAAIRDGHELGNHGHSNSWHALLRAVDLEREITLCDTLIRELYQAANVPLPAKLSYRPGCGMTTPTVLRIAHDHGYRVVLGSVYPHDPIIPFSRINHLFISSRLEPRDIVIAHDRLWTPGHCHRSRSTLDP